MSNSNSSSPPQFDVATAALEHLELLNRSNTNPLEVAAQFRTLLRSKKARGNTSTSKNDNSPPSSSNMDYTYMDYVAADATHRRRARSRGRADRRSKSLGRIQYDLEEDDDANNQSAFSHLNQDQSSLNFEHEQSHLRSTIDDANIYYNTSARYGGLLTTTNNSARQYLPESHSCFGLSKWHDEGEFNRILRLSHTSFLCLQVIVLRKIFMLIQRWVLIIVNHLHISHFIQVKLSRAIQRYQVHHLINNIPHPVLNKITQHLHLY